MKPLLLLLLTALTALAGETTVTQRVTGLFSPDREAALRASLEATPEVKLVSVDFDHAEAVLSYDPGVAFKGLKPEKIVEALNDVVRKGTHFTMGIVPLDPTPKDQLTRIEIPIAGLDCKACCLAAYESVYKIDGVAAATASFKEGRVTALIDPVRTNRDALIAALKKRNVDVTP